MFESYKLTKSRHRVSFVVQQFTAQLKNYALVTPNVATYQSGKFLVKVKYFYLINLHPKQVPAFGFFYNLIAKTLHTYKFNPLRPDYGNRDRLGGILIRGFLLNLAGQSLISLNSKSQICG